MNETARTDSECIHIRELVESVEYYSACLAAGDRDLRTPELPDKPGIVSLINELIREHGKDHVAPAPYWFWPVRDNPEVFYRALSRCNFQLSDSAKAIVDYWCGEPKGETESQEDRGTINMTEALESRCFDTVLRELVDDPTIAEETSSILARTRATVWLDPSWVPDFDRHDASCLGGIPNLASHTEWPYDRDGRRAFFVGQLNCRDLADQIPGVLPPEGLLVLFIDQDIENLCKHGQHPCHVVYRPGESSIGIRTLPEDYPLTGTWMCNVHDLDDELGSTFDLYRAKTWPRTDLALHRAVSFVPEDFAPVMHEIESRYVIEKVRQIRGVEPDQVYKQRVLPRTLAWDCGKPNLSPEPYQRGFPWTRFHIARTLRHLLHKVREQFALMRWKMGGMYVEFGMGERYGRHRTSKGEYFGIRVAPDHLIDAHNLPEMLESARGRGGQKEWDALLFWLDLDEFYKEARDRLEACIGDPFAEPTDEEKEGFIDWLAGWVNSGSWQSRKGHDALVASGHAVRVSRWHGLAPDSHSAERWSFFANRLPSECEAALTEATVLCVGHSPRTRLLLPQEALDAVVARFGKNRPIHSCLGYGHCIQHAAKRHKDKVLLLEVRTDRAMLTNFGDGALQFWIDPKDLAALRLDQAFVTIEST
jgi:hypothetical protein